LASTRTVLKAKDETKEMNINDMLNSLGKANYSELYMVTGNY